MLKFLKLSLLCATACVTAVACSGTKIDTMKDANCCDGGYEFRAKNRIDHEKIAADLRTQLAASERERQRLGNELVAAQKQNASLSSHSSDVERQLADRDREMASLKSSAADSANQLSSVQSERDRLTSELAASQASLAAAQAGAGDKDRLTADLAGAQAERDKLAGELAASQAERDKLAGDLGASQASLQSGVGDRDKLAAELAASQASLAALQAAGAGEKDKQAAELAAAKQRTDDLEKQLADRDRELAGLRGDLSTEMAKLKEAQRGLIRALRPQIENQNITVDLNNERLLINLAAGYLFGSGEDQLKPAGTDALKQVGAILKDFPEYKVAVDGHTDDRPLRPTLKKKFASNKELSEARATNASRALADGGLSGTKISGYADSQPVASNATDGGRAKNRRVEVRVTR